MKKAILLGDYKKAPYHPLDKVEQELCSIFKGTIEVSCTDDYDVLLYDRLKKYDLCICYSDCWNGTLSPEQSAGLLAYVSLGGGLLAIHNGISLQVSNECAQLIGAKFTGHPPYTKLSFRVSPYSHSITDGIGNFELEDEPYRFDIQGFINSNIILEYYHEGEYWPGAWTHKFGLGRVIYLMPGHNVSAIQHPAYRKIILRSGLWAVSGDETGN